jgi:hypothetical protein
MKLDLRSAALGAALAVGVGALLSAQATTAIQAATEILSVKVRGPVDVRQSVGEVVRVNSTTDSKTSEADATEYILYTVPPGKQAVLRRVRGLKGDSIGFALYREVDPAFNVNPGPPGLPASLEKIDVTINIDEAGAPADVDLYFGPGEPIWVRAWDSPSFGGESGDALPFYVTIELVPVL